VSIAVESLLSQLRTVVEAIERFDAQIAARAKKLPDFALFESLPGAGAALAPRLLVAFGERRERFPNAAAFQKYVGVAPDTVANVGAYWVGQKLVEGGASGNSWAWKLPAHFPAGRFVRVKVDGGTFSQGGRALSWDGHGYYEVSLDTGALDWAM